MADKTSIFKVRIDISNIDLHRYEQLCFTVALDVKESIDHLVMRLIAYAMVPDDKLSFGRSLCVGVEPDVMVRDYDDHYIYWIDAGFPAIERVKKASHQADNVIIFSMDESAWLDDNHQDLVNIKNLNLVLFEQQVVKKLAQQISKNINWSIVIDGNRIGISDNHNYVESHIQRINATNSNEMAVL